MQAGSLAVDRAFLDLECFPRELSCVGYQGVFPSLIRLPFVFVFGNNVFQWEVFFISAGILLVLVSTLWLTGVLESVLDIRISSNFVDLIIGAAPALSTPFVFLSSRPLLYEEALIWATGMSLLALVLAIKYWTQPRLVFLLWLSAVAVGGILSRPSGGGLLGSLLLVIVVGRHTYQSYRNSRTSLALIPIAILPFMAFASINQAKFGQPFAIPFNIHEGVASSSIRSSRLERVGTPNRLDNIPTLIFQYLRPDTIEVEKSFPYFGFRFPAINTEAIRSIVHENPGVKALWPIRSDDIETEMTASLPPTYGVYLLASISGALLWLSFRRTHSCGPKSLNAHMLLTFGICAAATTLPTITAYGVTHRYLIDFLPLVLLVGTISLLRLWFWAENYRTARIMFYSGLGVVFTLSFFINLGLTFHFQRTWAGELLPEYRDLRTALLKKRDEFLVVLILGAIVSRCSHEDESLNSKRSGM